MGGPEYLYPTSPPRPPPPQTHTTSERACPKAPLWILEFYETWRENPIILRQLLGPLEMTRGWGALLQAADPHIHPVETPKPSFLSPASSCPCTPRGACVRVERAVDEQPRPLPCHAVSITNQQGDLGQARLTREKDTSPVPPSELC